MSGSSLPELIYKNPVDKNVFTFRSQAEKVELWLRQYGFTYNPFQYVVSERDANLTRHFVEGPDFEKTLGLEDRLLFARTGDGKTATRLWLQSYYRDAISDHNVFAFSYLIPQDIAVESPPDILDHIEPILAAAVRHAFVFLALRGIDLPNLQNDQTAQALARRFAAYFDEYYGLINSWRNDLQQALVDYSLQQVIRNLDPVYDDLEALETVGSVNLPWLKRWLQLLNVNNTDAQHALPTKPLQRWRHFCDLVQVTGIQAVLILVDGVDVKPNVAISEQATGKSDIVSRMEAIVHPLLAALENKTLGRQVGWKLFLPMELYLPLAPFFSKKFAHSILFWDDTRLRQLLKFRLSAATNGVIVTLSQLTEEDVSVDLETFLIVQSLSSPRYLLYYVNKIFALHVDQAANDKLPGKLSGRLLSQIRYLVHRPT